jgi:phosphoribosylglycinamide formyltransferase
MAASASASPGTDSGAGYSGVNRKRLAVFVSGGGSNFRSIHKATLGGKVNGDVVALITDKPGDDTWLLRASLLDCEVKDVTWIGGSDAVKWNVAGCGGAEYARCNCVPVVMFPKSKSASKGVPTDALLNVLRLVNLISVICNFLVYTSHRARKNIIIWPLHASISSLTVKCIEITSD